MDLKARALGSIATGGAASASGQPSGSTLAAAHDLVREARELLGKGIDPRKSGLTGKSRAPRHEPTAGGAAPHSIDERASESMARFIAESKESGRSAASKGQRRAQALIAPAINTVTLPHQDRDRLCATQRAPVVEVHRATGYLGQVIRQSSPWTVTPDAVSNHSKSGGEAWPPLVADAEEGYLKGYVVLRPRK